MNANSCSCLLLNSIDNSTLRDEINLQIPQISSILKEQYPDKQVIRICKCCGNIGQISDYHHSVYLYEFIWFVGDCIFCK